MRACAKVWFSLGFVLILLGGILFTGVMSSLDWDFTRLSTVSYETESYVFEESFSRISLHTDTADVLFVSSEDGICRVECYKPETEEYSVSVAEGTLSVRETTEKSWQIGIDFSSPTITVYLPQREYDSLAVNGSTGDIELPQNFSFGNVHVSLSTGDIRVENVSAGSMELSVSTGRVNALGVDCAGDLTVHVSTGDVYLTDISCHNLKSSGNTGDLSLRNVLAKAAFTFVRTTGDIRFDGCDAEEVFVETDTGDVAGSLLSGKVFVTETSTGKIDVPKTTDGGRCEVKTSTGDIQLYIQ